MKIRIRAWMRCGEWEESGDKPKFMMVDAEHLAFEEYEPLCQLLVDIPDQQYFMLSTGLQDKNGKEIFEGDIVHHKYLKYPGIPIRGIWNAEDDGGISWQSTGFYIEPVKWQSGQVGWLTSLPGACPEDDSNEMFEVRGNIHQNPEMVKEEK